MSNDELIKEVKADESIFDRIRFFDISDLKENNKQFFTVLKDGNKVIGIARTAHFRLTSKNENYLSISYFSIDKEYRYKGYSRMMLDELFKHAGKNDYTISTSSYSYLGKIQLQKLIHEYANKYNVNLIDKDEMLDTEKSYVKDGDKYFHRDEL